MTKLLDGIRVVDAGLVAVGPWAAILLGQLGAEVIKIQPPMEKDSNQFLPPTKNGMGLLYMAMNANKKSIVLNPKIDRDREIILKLAKSADVFIENLRPGVMERVGLGYETLSQINPRIIYCSASPYGSKGPLANYAAADPYMEAFSGFASLQGQEETSGETLRSYGHLDLTTSLLACQAVMLGLLAREKTGLGEKVEVSLLSGAIALQRTRMAEYFATGINPKPLGSASAIIAPSQAFKCLDDEYILVSAQNEKHWLSVCEALNLKHLMNDTRFKTNTERVKNRRELASTMEGVFAEKPAYFWWTFLSRYHIPCARLNTFEDVLDSLYLLNNQMFVERDTPWGKVKFAGPAWKFSGNPTEVKPPPMPDGQKEEILQEISLAEKVRSETTFREGEAEKTLPLAGIRVIDVAGGVATSYCSMQLGHAGAEVIKIEPPEGDWLRGIGPFIGDESSLFLALNSDKKSVIANLREASGRQIIHKIGKHADVFLIDLPPSEAMKFEMDYATLKRINPQIIYCLITEIEENCPWGKVATELEVQAMSGYLSFVGEKGQPPVRVGADIAMTSAGMNGFLGILAALFRRNKTRKGQKVEISALSGLMSMAWWCSPFSDPDDWLGWILSGPFDHAEVGYKTEDVPIMFGFALAGLEKAKDAWPKFAKIIGLGELLNDPWFAEWGSRTIGVGRDAQKMKPLFETALTSKTAAELAAIINKLGGQCAPFNNYEQLFKNPQVLAMNIIAELAHPTLGKIKSLNPPYMFSRSVVAVRNPPPLLGQNTEEVLSSIGDVD